MTWKELECKDGTPYPIEFINDGRVISVVVMFELIRSIWNKPLIINSAYRTYYYNKAIKGSLNSQHIQGRALDIQPPEDVSIENFYTNIKERAKNFGINGLGKYNNFIHVDTRIAEYLVEWNG